MDALKHFLRLVFWSAIILLFSPLLLVYLVIQGRLFVGRHGVMPIYSFAKYRDHLMPVVHQQEFDERAVQDQGSLEQLNDMDFQRQSKAPRPHPYDQRFGEIRLEKKILAKREPTAKEPPPVS